MFSQSDGLLDSQNVCGGKSSRPRGVRLSEREWPPFDCMERGFWVPYPNSRRATFKLTNSTHFGYLFHVFLYGKRTGTGHTVIVPDQMFGSTCLKQMSGTCQVEITKTFRFTMLTFELPGSIGILRMLWTEKRFVFVQWGENWSGQFKKISSPFLEKSSHINYHLTVLFPHQLI